MKTALKIISVLQIICGIILAVLGLASTGLFAAAGSEGAALVVLSVVLLVLSGAIGILSGVLGLRAAKDPAKAMPAVVMGGISLAFAVITLVTSFSPESAAQCVVPAIYFGCALGLKNSAGKGGEA